MAQHAPPVSVVVPAFNEAPAVLAESLNSLVAQTFADFECIVVDESTDASSAAACKALCDRDDRFRYVRPPKRIGLSSSLNLGVQMSRGDLIARFDSDDVCVPDRLERQVAYLSAHPQVGVLGGGLELMDEAGRTVAFRDYPAEQAEIERRFQSTTAIAHPTVMMRRHLLLEHGGYDSDFRFAEDLDLWLRLLNRGVRFANLPGVLVRYRQQTTRRNPLHWRFNLRARLKNFSMRQFPRRVAGICAIAIWGSLPDRLQQLIFRSVVLRRLAVAQQ
jgi:glycosyltransferase involved in cell wall biosynthesis